METFFGKRSLLINIKIKAVMNKNIFFTRYFDLFFRSERKRQATLGVSIQGWDWVQFIYQPDSGTVLGYEAFLKVLFT